LLEAIAPEHRQKIYNQIYNRCISGRDPEAFLTRECCTEHILEDGKMFDLLKLEWSGPKFTALNSKTYCGVNNSGKVKFSSKGLQKNKLLQSYDNVHDVYNKVLEESNPSE